MRRGASVARLVVSGTTAAVLFVLFAVPPVSACSLAEPVALWLQVVLSHGLATLNPDCTLTWKTGETTDLNGNLITPPALLFMQRYGIAFFVVGVVLFLVGAYLTFRSRGMPAHGEDAGSGTR